MPKSNAKVKAQVKIEAIIEEADENDAQQDGLARANKTDSSSPEPGNGINKSNSKVEVTPGLEAQDDV